MNPTITRLCQFLLLVLFSTSVFAKSFDPWQLDPHGMAIFIWTQHGDPPLTQQHQFLLGNSIEKDFSLAGKYYPTPEQLADFFLTWFAHQFPGDKAELRSTIIAWESIKVSQADLDKALENDIRDYVRRHADCPSCPRDLLRERLIRVCDNPTEDGPCQRGCTPWCDRQEPEGGGPSYEIANRREIERRYDNTYETRKSKLERFAHRIRRARFKEQHPDLHGPSYLTADTVIKGRPAGYREKLSAAHVRAYHYDRNEVFAGVIMENVIREIRAKGN
jgi:hypothetical protein